MAEPMVTLTATTWHDPNRGWLTLPAGTRGQRVGLTELPAREQRVFKTILNRNPQLALVHLVGKFRALPVVDLRTRKRGAHNMVDPTERELAAMRAAGPMAGEYIESLGKTDIALFTVEEFLTLIRVIVGAYLEAKAKLDIDNTWDDIPF